MSTPNPTQVIAEGMREVATEGQKGTPGTREDGQLWGAFPNTMTLTDLAEHVVSKLTDAGYSIVPVTKVVGECEDKYPLSDPPLLCQRVSGHPGIHEAMDASGDRFVWPNLAAAEGEKP